MVELGADTSICSTTTQILDAGNPGSTYLWSTGETSQIIEVGFDQVYGVKAYSVVVTSPASCVNSDEITINWVNCSGIDELSDNDLLSIYPNPATSIISVQSVVFSQQSAIIEIYCLNGKMWIQKHIPKGTKEIEIDLSDLESGLYFCRLTLKDKSITQKLFIK